MTRLPRPALAFAALAGAVLAVGVASLGVGDTPLSPAQVVAALFDPAADPLHRTVVAQLRLPRVVLAAVIGLGLGAAGAAYQALFRNPLADPFVVGASSGAAVGAAVVIVAGGTATAGGVGPASAGAFVGAIGAVGLVYAVAAVGRLPPLTLLLAGSVVSTMLGSCVWLLMALSDKDVPKIVGWLLGGLSGRGWDTVFAATPMILLGTGVLCLLGRPLDAVRYGDEVARSLGLRVGAVLAVVLAAASLAVAAAVAAGGVIGFVGLAAPHLARPLVGAAHAKLVPASGLVGAGLLVAADVIARGAHPPHELPLGVITAVAGGPLFLVVLRHRAGSES